MNGGRERPRPPHLQLASLLPQCQTSSLTPYILLHLPREVGSSCKCTLTNGSTSQHTGLKRSGIFRRSAPSLHHVLSLIYADILEAELLTPPLLPRGDPLPRVCRLLAAANCPPLAVSHVPPLSVSPNLHQRQKEKKTSKATKSLMSVDNGIFSDVMLTPTVAVRKGRGGVRGTS